MTSSKPLIAGNWKMNRLPSEANTWLRELLRRLEESPDTYASSELLLAVPFTHLHGMSALAFGSAVSIGAQDLSAHDSGAYTGEVSAAMLRDLGVRYVIVGHSERRAHHREDDSVVNAKVLQALKHRLTPILCVGESQEQRDAGEAEQVVAAQLRRGLIDVEPPTAEDLVVAYEPVWAIGTGRTATADDAQTMSATIRSELLGRYPKLAADIRILYGGSMKPGNAGELLAQPDVNGGLIGGASLEIDDYLSIAAVSA